MNLQQLDEKLSIGAQIAPHQLEEIAKLGFKSIICNRPDGESSDQPNFSEIEAAATKHGLTASYLPIINGPMDQGNVDKFGELLEKAEGKVFAYCRSGMRSNALWKMCQGPNTSSPWQALMGAIRR